MPFPEEKDHHYHMRIIINATWSRRNLDDETRIGSSADPFIILLMDSNGKFLNPRIFKRYETVIKYMIA